MANAGLAQSIIDKQQWIDAISDAVQPVVRGAFSETGEAGKVVKDLLNGVWLGHPLHPVITDVPIGAWTMTSIFDLLSIAAGGDEALDRASDITLGVGILGAVAAAITGITDWSDTSKTDRRMGMAHALANVAGLGLNLASLGLRAGSRKGNNRGTARALSYGGYAFSGLAAFIAGELIYNLGQSVNRNAWTNGPLKFTDLAALDEIQPGRMSHFEVEGKDVVIVQDEEGIHAFGGICPHRGCELWKGKLEGQTVICQCHGSEFDITDGTLLHGPATAPVLSYEVRRYGGKLQIRERQAKR